MSNIKPSETWGSKRTYRELSTACLILTTNILCLSVENERLGSAKYRYPVLGGDVGLQPSLKVN